MSAPTNHPPIPRQPIGSTFIVSISVLGAFAALQLLAVLWHYIPLVRQHVAETSAQARLAEQQQQQTAPAVQVPSPQSPSNQATLPQGDLQKVEKLLAESDRNFRIGQFDAALKPLEELEGILPGDPQVLYRKAMILMRLDQPGEAAMALEEAVKHPGLPAEARAQMEKQIDQFSRQADAMGLRREPRSSTMPDVGGDEMREDTGLQPGANLGIVDVRLKDGKAGMKTLLVAVKSRPDASINVQDVKIYVYFYEENEDGEVLITESKVVTQWLSPPVDWSANEPELLEGQYIMPESGLAGSSTSNGAPGRKYHGYVVAVYYNKELQDFRSDPSRLAKDFPLPLYLKESAE